MDRCPAIELIEDVRSNAKISIEVVSDEDSFFTMEAVWNNLLEKSGIDYPFLTHQWVRIWWEAFGCGKKLHILLAKAGDELLAIAPLMLTQRKFYGVPLRCLEFLANVHTPRFDFIVAGRRDEVYRSLWSYLREQRKLWDVLLFRQLTSESATLQEVSNFAKQANLACGQWHSADSPYVEIRTNWEDYFNQTPSKHRANVRRRLKRLSELGPVELEPITSKDELEGALEEGFRIEGAAWKDRNGTSIRANPQSRAFYSKLADVFSRNNWLQLCFLKIAGQRIAFHYSLRFHDKVCLLKPGYTPEHASYSPVNLLCFLFLQDAFARGLNEFDFLGLRDEWKMQWTRKVRSHYWLYVFSKSPLPLAVYLAKFHVLPRLRQNSIYGAFRNVLVKLMPNGRPAGEHL